MTSCAGWLVFVISSSASGRTSNGNSRSATGHTRCDAAENATIWTAFQQLQTYKAELPTLFTFNELLVVSDGMEARIGSLTSGREWFKPWRTITGETLADPHRPSLRRG